MSDSTNNERLRKNFGDLRAEDERVAPPFERSWNKARLEVNRPRNQFSLRFALAGVLLCAVTTALTLLVLVPRDKMTVEPVTPAGAASSELPAPRAEPSAETPLEPASPASGAEECAACPPTSPAALESERGRKRLPKASRQHRKRQPASSNPCVEC